MNQRLAKVLATLVILMSVQSVGFAQEEGAERPRDSAAFTVIRAHAIGLWYPDGAGEMRPARDTIKYDPAVSIAFEIGWCPTANGRSRSLMDLAFRGSVILPQGDREEAMFLVSVGIGLNQKL